MAIPHVKKHLGVDTLFVHDKPFIALAGEIHNSSASHLPYMETNVWPHLTRLSMNTLLVPIYWEQIEAEENTYDFSLLEGLIQQARARDFHLILLWFGLWKNSESTYIPEWMKRDRERFFYARGRQNQVINSISPFCQAAVDKDAKALANVMAHLKVYDGEHQTVIMIQVENEIGLLGTDRDYSAAATAVFNSQVPPQVAQLFQVQGHWTEAFGEGAEERMMCFQFAQAIETITRGATEVYPLPCYVNAWLRQYPWYPGSYPVGGPIAGMAKMWKYFAPSITAMAPDIYVPNVSQILDEYAFEGNPLIVPEVRKDAVTASYALYAFAKHHAMVYSPFGIEDLALDEDAIQKPPRELMAALNIDPTAFETNGSGVYLKEVYGWMHDFQGIYLAHRHTEQWQCYIKRSETDFGTYLTFENYNISVAYGPKQSHKPLAAGVILQIDPNTFYVIGMMSKLTFMPKHGCSDRVEILSIKEGNFQQDQWIEGRTLNGDERMFVTLNDHLTCYKIKVHAIAQ